MCRIAILDLLARRFRLFQTQAHLGQPLCGVA